MIMPKKLPLFFPLFLLLASGSLFANLHDFETTRLKSTAGTGVGSVLISESAVLNPAPLAFFNFSTLFVQRTTMDMTSESSQVGISDNEFSDRSSGVNLIAADAKGKIKGAFSYLTQTEGNWNRKRLSAALARPVGPKSSLGLIFHHTEDVPEFKLKGEKQKSNQLVFGAMHAINSDMTLGVIITDPAKSVPGATKAIVGIQYVAKNIISIMFDGGADYTSDKISETLIYRGGLQVKFFADLFIRAGLSEDMGLKEKATGIGLGWSGPKLIIDLALKSTKATASNAPLLADGQTVKETSFSLTYRF